MVQKIVLAMVLGMSLVAADAMAARPYGAAGCGLGSMVLGREGNQIFAATTNGTSYSQTFGITSGTSNCVSDGTMAKHNQLPVFIEANRGILSTQAARGEGESIEALSHVLGCQDSNVLAQKLNENYGAVFAAEASNSEITQNIQRVVAEDQALATQCHSG